MMLPRPYSPSTGDYFRRMLNVDPDKPVGDLPLDRVTRAAAIEAADSRVFAETTHLLRLIELLPLPGHDESRFWWSLGEAAGKNGLALLPGNSQHHVRAALRGDGEPLALHFQFVFERMTAEDHAAAAKVLNPVLAKRLHGSEGAGSYLGRHWLEDCEATVWRIIALSADDPDIRDAEARQRDFQAAWGHD
ncbi:hypothetical protein ACFQ67_21135 [Streptomyces sp. NPDC056488]|uniref:hypothetical protein n=1 Tax=Streptomyces sp. NPDC056488 TaxID=3345836 RepID=UPI00367DF14E